MTTTDPEMDSLFAAARKMADEKHPAVTAYAEECRTKSSSPAPLRVEPPTPLPCPFCGGAARRIEGLSGDHWVACVRCESSSEIKDSPEQAAVAWNTRYPCTPPLSDRGQ